jgi:sugar phosphate isomerase/epimerase
MQNLLPRRQFLSSMIGIPAIATTGLTFTSPPNHFKASAKKVQRLKPGLNAYSFNDQLMKGTMSIADMLEFCAEAGFDAVDITGYYFNGYPQPPSDKTLYQVKRKAFELGIEISGTGVRNDFTIADSSKRAKEVEMVKKWIEVAAKLGAPVIRIFAGVQKNEGVAIEKITDWMLKDIQSCTEYAQQYGVIVGLQNHNDFIQTADQVNKIIEQINSPWMGLILDTGSYRVHDAYEEIARSVKHAVNWQVKEKIFIGGNEIETDLVKLMGIIKRSDYSGYLPIETLGPGDTKSKITTLLNKLNAAMA